MIKKHTFLIANAIKIDLKEPQGIFNNDLQINVLSLNNETPLILAGGGTQTHSKTMSAPGDDDPDPERNSCY